mmetsp:Transcript_7718/g.18372  ORF Transcript_7718/g.18372 Transcript_7718/m.18372 type:complete len:202 (+) Transcript_7718:211-816(+)
MAHVARATACSRVPAPPCSRLVSHRRNGCDARAPTRAAPPSRRPSSVRVSCDYSAARGTTCGVDLEPEYRLARCSPREGCPAQCKRSTHRVLDERRRLGLLRRLQFCPRRLPALEGLHRRRCRRLIHRPARGWSDLDPTALPANRNVHGPRHISLQRNRSAHRILNERRRLRLLARLHICPRGFAALDSLHRRGSRLLRLH